MANILDYILRITDDASDTLQKVSGLSKVLGGDLSAIRNKIETLGVAFEDVGRSAGVAGSQIGTDISGGLRTVSEVIPPVLGQVSAAAGSLAQNAGRLRGAFSGVLRPEELAGGINALHSVQVAVEDVGRSAGVAGSQIGTDLSGGLRTVSEVIPPVLGQVSAAAGTLAQNAGRLRGAFSGVLRPEELAGGINALHSVQVAVEDVGRSAGVAGSQIGTDLSGGLRTVSEVIPPVLGQVSAAAGTLAQNAGRLRGAFSGVLRPEELAGGISALHSVRVAVEDVGRSAGVAGSQIGTDLSGGLRTVSEVIPPVLGQVSAAAGTLAQNAGRLRGAFSGVLRPEELAGGISALHSVRVAVEDVGRSAGVAGNQIGADISGGLRTVSEVIPPVLGQVSAAAGTLTQNAGRLRGAFSGVLRPEELAGGISALHSVRVAVEDVGRSAGVAGSQIGTDISGGLRTVSEVLTSMWDRVRTVLSNGLSSFSGAVSSAINRIKGAVSSRPIEETGRSIASLSEKLDQLRQRRDIQPITIAGINQVRRINSEINRTEALVGKLQKMDGSPIKRMFKDAFNSIPALLTNPITMIGATIGAAIKEGTAKDTQLSNLTTLLNGNADAANNLYNNIRKYANVTPYDTSGLVNAQKTMMSFGISSDKSFKVLKQIGDISLGDSQKMESLSLAFSQATSAGKLQGQDLMQMINAGFNPLNVISEKTGKSMAELRQEMAKGQIGSDQLAQAFQWATEKGGQFYQGAEKAGQTLGGRISTLTDSFKTMLLGIYDAVVPIISPIIDLATKVLDSIGGGITWLINKFKEGNPVIIAIAGAIGLITTAFLVYNAYTAIASTVQSLFTAEIWATNFAFMANPVFWIIAGIVALVAAVVVCWNKFEGFRKVIMGVWEVIKGFGLAIKNYVINRFKELLSGITGIGQALMHFFKGEWKEAWESGKNAVIDLSGARSKAQLFNDGVAAVKSYSAGAAKGAKMTPISLTGLKNKIMPSSVPGAAGESVAGGGAAAGIGGGTDAKTAKTQDAIATGGTKNTTVNITIGNLVKEFLVNTSGDLRSSAEQIRDVIMQEMTKAVAMGAGLGS